MHPHAQHQSAGLRQPDGLPEQAKPLLHELAKGDHVVSVPARWYLALHLLREGKVREARPLLQGLVADPIFGDQARAVLEQI